MFHLTTGDATTAHSRAGVPGQGTHPVQGDKTPGGSDRRSFATVFTDARARDSADTKTGVIESGLPARPDAKEGGQSVSVQQADAKEDSVAQNAEPSDISLDHDLDIDRRSDPSFALSADRETSGRPEDMPAAGPSDGDLTTSDPHAAIATGHPHDPESEGRGAQTTAEAAHISRHDRIPASHSVGPDPETVTHGTVKRADPAGHSSEAVAPARKMPGGIADNRLASLNAHLLTMTPSPTTRRPGADVAVSEFGSAAFSSLASDKTEFGGTDTRASALAIAPDGPGDQPLTRGTPSQSPAVTAASRTDLADSTATLARAAEIGTSPNSARSPQEMQAADVSIDAARRIAQAGSIDARTSPNPSHQTEAEPAAAGRHTDRENRDAGAADLQHSRSAQPTSLFPGPQIRPDAGLTQAKPSAHIPVGPNDPIAPASILRAGRASDQAAQPTPRAVARGERVEGAPSAPSPSSVTTPSASVAPTHPIAAARNPLLPADERARDAIDETGRTAPSAAHTSQVETSAPLRQSALAAMRSPDLPRHVIEQLTTGFRGAGEKSAEIHLNPAELGRVRISLHTGDAGIFVSVTADRPETLDLLRRHTDMLAQDFRDIGYGAAQFSFGQSDNPRSGPDHGRESNVGGPTDTALNDGEAPATNPQVGHVSIALDRVDIRL